MEQILRRDFVNRDVWGVVEHGAEMIVVTVRIQVSPENKAEARRVILPLLGPTRAEAGCVSCDLYTSAEDDSSMVLVERWKSMPDLERHIRSDHYRNVLAWIDMSTEPPAVHFDSLSKSQGLELIVAIRDGRNQVSAS